MGLCACDPKQPDASASAPSTKTGDGEEVYGERGKTGSAQAPTMGADGTPRFDKAQIEAMCDQLTPALVGSVTGIDEAQWQVSRERRGCRMFTKSGSVVSLGVSVKKDVAIAKRVYAETLAPKDQVAQEAQARAEVRGGLAKQGLDEERQGPAWPEAERPWLSSRSRAIW